MPRPGNTLYQFFTYNHSMKLSQEYQPHRCGQLRIFLHQGKQIEIRDIHLVKYLEIG